MTSLLKTLRDLTGGAVHPSATRSAAVSTERITWETIDARSDDGRYLVHGSLLTTTGTVPYKVGDRVAVAWEGDTPRVILGHSWRRAQFGRIFRAAAQGIVEELFIASLDGESNDVWYRNHEKVVKLGVSALLPGKTLSGVKWGFDGQSLAVSCSDGTYAIFAIEREPNIVSPEAPGGDPVLVWSGKPLESNSPLVSVTYEHRFTKTFKYWVGKLDISSGWHVKYNGLVYTWGLEWDRVDQGWETTAETSGSASVSALKTFGLHDMLDRRITDAYGQRSCSAEVTDWFLDGQRRLMFLVEAQWDYFWIGTSATGTGQLHYPFGYGQNGMEGRDETISVGGLSVGCIGAKKRTNQEIVPEKHVFLFDGVAQSVVWATAANSVTQGYAQTAFDGRIIEHHLSNTASYPGTDGLPDPHMPGDPPRPPVSTESYYGGANWSNLPLTAYRQSDMACADEAGQAISSTGTYQLFDPGRFPNLTAPFALREPGEYARGTSMIGGWTAAYEVRYSTLTGGTQVLWFYRVATVRVFQANQEAHLFIVTERYPFFSGTGYINDIPQIHVGIFRQDGSLVRTLCDWQFGIASADLLTANAHRLLWSYTTPGWNTLSFRYTDLDSGAELGLTMQQLEALLSSKARLFSPDFMWDRVDPEEFSLIADLPTLTQDEALSPYSKLTPTDAAAEGSVRIVNDESILAPLDRYRAE